MMETSDQPRDALDRGKVMLTAADPAALDGLLVVTWAGGDADVSAYGDAPDPVGVDGGVSALAHAVTAVADGHGRDRMSIAKTAVTVARELDQRGMSVTQRDPGDDP